MAQQGRRLLSAASAADYLDMTVNRLAKLRLDGSGPPFVKNNHRVFYSVDEIDQWIKQNTRQSTSDTGTSPQAA